LAPFAKVKLFAVVGMHRCGTSIVSRALNLLGAHLGPAEDMMPAKPDNPTGFWETLSVAQVHDDLFAALGGRWDLPPVLEPGWETSAHLDAFVSRIGAIVESHFSAADIAIWKDPRGSMFLSLWRRVVPIEGIVVCVRRPEEVAGSLALREGLTSERVAALWLRYVVAAWLDPAPRMLVTFDESHDRPRELARRLAEFTGTPPANESTLAELRRFVDPALRHYHPNAGEIGPMMQLARAAYALLTTEADEITTPFFRALSNFWRADARSAEPSTDFRTLFEEFGPSVVALSRGQ
jgi:hypothetical protein